MENKGSVKHLNRKEHKRKRKEESKEWKDAKLQKKQIKLEKKTENQSIPEITKVKKDYTVSIALPGNILDNAQTPTLMTELAGQIGRAAAIFKVNEIIIFCETELPSVVEDDQSLKLYQKNKKSCFKLGRILEYLECPQYLRKRYFPILEELKYVGLLYPLDTPHHLRKDDESEFREGIVLDQQFKQGSSSGSYVYIGLEKNAVIDKVLETNLRVTVQLDKKQTSKEHFTGKAVSPSYPYKNAGIYCGYTTRFAKSLSAVFSECPFKGGYDVTIGTSEKGSSIGSFQMPFFKHLLIVFGGLAGIEACIEGDQSLKARDPKDLFQYYLKICPELTPTTIATQEAIFITLRALNPAIDAVQNITKND